MKYKNELIITLIISILIIFLRIINVLQVDGNGFGNPIFMISLIIMFSSICILVQKKIDNNIYQEQKNYENLDILKYMCAILILILHLRPFQLYSDQLDLAFNNIITRICVPMFFIITGYFVAKKEKNNCNYIKEYIRKMIPTYLKWSLIYLPVIIITILQLMPTISSYIPDISIYLLIPLFILVIPIALIIALVYTGIYYHLWYFPAVMLSLFVLNKWKKKFKVKYLLLISFILLMFGATETYYGVLPLSFQNLLKFYYNIFFTTRNFLFFGLFYITLGYFVGSREKINVKYCFEKFIISCFFLTFEAILLHDSKRLDSNILLSCVPLTYYLFLSVIYLPKLKSIKYPFRDLSKYYYLIHPMIIFILFNIGILNVDKLPTIQILYALLGTHIISFVIIKTKQLKIRKMN